MCTTSNDPIVKPRRTGNVLRNCQQGVKMSRPLSLEVKFTRNNFLKGDPRIAKGEEVKVTFTNFRISQKLMSGPHFNIVYCLVTGIRISSKS
jgi:hypothetical protein